MLDFAADADVMLVQPLCDNARSSRDGRVRSKLCSDALCKDYVHACPVRGKQHIWVGPTSLTLKARSPNMCHFNQLLMQVGSGVCLVKNQAASSSHSCTACTVHHPPPPLA